MEITQLKESSERVVTRLTRWSYVVKALLFASVAVFTYRIATQFQGPLPNRKEVLQGLVGSPLGRVLLGFIVLTLLAHTVWRVLETYNDPYDKGRSPGGLLHRFTYLLSGISYAVLALTAVQLLFRQNIGYTNGRQFWVATMLEQPWGKWVVMAFGGILLLWAGVQAYKGISGTTYRGLDLDGVAAPVRWLIAGCGFVGFVTYAGVLGGAGWYLVRGGWAENPRWVKNMDDLLTDLLTLPQGTLWMKLAALGLLLFAVFMLAMARYFPFKLSQEEE